MQTPPSSRNPSPTPAARSASRKHRLSSPLLLLGEPPKVNLSIDPPSAGPFAGLVFYLIDVGIPDAELADLDSLIPKLGGTLLPERADAAVADYLLTGLTSASRIGRHVPEAKPDIIVLDYTYVFEVAKRGGGEVDMKDWEGVVPQEFRPDRRVVEAQERVRSWVGVDSNWTVLQCPL